MKKRILYVLSTIGLMITLAGCGDSSTKIKDNAEMPEEQQFTQETENKRIEAIQEQEDTGALAQCVMVDGHIYKNTGYMSSMVGCGNMDGSIDSMVEPSKLPEQDNQSNFGTGYSYQRGGSMQILVVMDGEKYIFQDLASSSLEIPKEVANFTAEIKEIGEGSMVVSYITHPDGFRIDKGNYVVPMDNLQSEVKIGDIVTIWFNGRVMESDPAQIGVVYRIKKADDELSNVAKAYEDVLAEYRDMVQNDFYEKFLTKEDRTDYENCFGEHIGIEARSHKQRLFYANVDIDQNGIEELVIAGKIDETENTEFVPHYYDLFTIDGEKVVPVFPDMDFGYRTNLDLRENGIIEVDESLSAAEYGVVFYKISDNGISPEWIETFMKVGNDKGMFVYSKNDTTITKEEYEAGIESFGNSIELDWKEIY